MMFNILLTIVLVTQPKFFCCLFGLLHQLMSVSLDNGKEPASDEVSDTMKEFVVT